MYIFIEVSNYWDHSLWAGATDRETEGTFKWNVGNGDKIYPPWYPGEPNNRFSNEHCLSLSRRETFNDSPCFSKHVFVCEKNQNV
jgi:hypothetical protein